MKHPVRTILAAALVVAALGAAPADARGGRHHGHYRYHHGHHGHHYGYLALPFAFFLGWAVNQSLRPEPYYYRPYRRGAQGCHFVIKDGVDAQGRPVRLGGTKCYDEYGRAFIVPGSPHVIGYY